MKRLLAASVLIFTLHAICHAGNVAYKYTQFEDFERDKINYIGSRIEINAFGRYTGGVLFVTRDPGKPNFLHITIEDLKENEKKNIKNSCSPNCNVTVQGVVEKDRLGLVVIHGENISFGNH